MLPARTSLKRLLPRAEGAGFIAAIAAIAGFEIARHPEYIEQAGSLIGYTPDLETTWLALAVLVGGWTDRQLSLLIWATWIGVPLLLAAPLWWLRGSSKQSHVAQTPTRGSNCASGTARFFIMSIGLFALSVTATALVGRQFQGMPPAYHDEYSYLFQAKTFLAGRLSFPADERSQFFAPMHVLNDNGVFASRYFPGVGMWLAPWLAVGSPYWGQYLAGGLVVLLVFWLGGELPAIGSDEAETDVPETKDQSKIATGFVAAMLCALSPGMLLFGNLLLSHHPTTLGLLGFVYCYSRALRSESTGWPLAGGCSLCLAMLCRPLTAFGFAFPFGVHLASRVWRGMVPRCVPRLVMALGPLVIGMVALAAYNARLTGNPLESPYGLYTRIYTPNHCYGFYNVTRGQRQAGPKVLDNYNRWASDLTPARAVRILGLRADASATWTLGRVSMAWLGGVLLVIFWRLPVEWKLLVSAIIGVHAVYFPFGFEGIFNLSYVFESMPLLCLCAGALIVWLLRAWTAEHRWGRVTWLAILLAFNLNDPALRLVRGISEIRFPRQYYEGFERRLLEAGVRPRAVVLIRPDPEDRHRDLVMNSPSLDDPILRARFRSTSDISELMQFFPDRQFWFYDAKTDVLAPLRAN